VQQAEQTPHKVFTLLRCWGCLCVLMTMRLQRQPHDGFGASSANPEGGQRKRNQMISNVVSCQAFAAGHQAYCCIFMFAFLSPSVASRLDHGLGVFWDSAIVFVDLWAYARKCTQTAFFCTYIVEGSTDGIPLQLSISGLCLPWQVVPVAGLCLPRQVVPVAVVVGVLALLLVAFASSRSTKLWGGMWGCAYAFSCSNVASWEGLDFKGALLNLHCAPYNVIWGDACTRQGVFVSSFLGGLWAGVIQGQGVAKCCLSTFAFINFRWISLPASLLTSWANKHWHTV